jgi:hypothetical protein
LSSEDVIHKIVNERDFVKGSSRQKEERKRIQSIVNEKSFVKNFKKSAVILEPIHSLLKYQSDSVKMNSKPSSTRPATEGTKGVGEPQPKGDRAQLAQNSHHREATHH